jgi:hypothetical protein
MNPQDFPAHGWLVILTTPLESGRCFEDVICWCLTRGDAEDLLAARGNDSAYRIQPAGPA